MPFFSACTKSIESPHLTSVKLNHIINLSNAEKRTRKPLHLLEKKGLGLEAF